ncbi:hypothetical protein JB92DRAFT_3116013 [Gautieria morchelliformis]|nr:hypothetical protein JB92DRAFT_3116013 [Gautieria morchelliformis]
MALFDSINIAQVDFDGEVSKLRAQIDESRTQYLFLQSAFDALSHEHESCKAELESLKQAHKNQQHQLNTALEKVNSLQDQLMEEGAAARAQAETQVRLIELLEREEMLKEQLRREGEHADRLDMNLT